MKSTMKYLLAIVVLVSVTACFDDRDDNGAFASEIKDFVWKGMNVFYLYKDEIPDLANDRFSSNQEYADYLNSHNSPESLFESLIFDRQNVDKYSWITSDYIALEQQFGGVAKNNGMKFGLRYVPGSSSAIFGYVQLVLPNSDAEAKGVNRGDIFTGVDGVPLTIDNYQSLLFSEDTYSIDLADYDNNGTPQTDDDIITANGNSVSLTKLEYIENPIFKTAVFDVDGDNVGYLMYNRFNDDFVEQLNNVFADFQSNNVQHLIIDLRYNPGGFVSVAAALASMTTGQFNNQVFTHLNYNQGLQNFNIDYNFINNIEGTPLNSLGLNKVYIIATGSSASASEMVINSLRPYIDVVHIGSTTEGKSQASVTVYDSPDFSRDGVNPNHTYAMQPLVAISVNSLNAQVPSSGLIPDIMLGEAIYDLGSLGDENEPLLSRALSEIDMTNLPFNYVEPVPLIADSNDEFIFAKEMYLDEPPAIWSTEQTDNNQ